MELPFVAMKSSNRLLKQIQAVAEGRGGSGGGGSSSMEPRRCTAWRKTKLAAGGHGTNKKDLRHCNEEKCVYFPSLARGQGENEVLK